MRRGIHRTPSSFDLWLVPARRCQDRRNIQSLEPGSDHLWAGASRDRHQLVFLSKKAVGGKVDWTEVFVWEATAQARFLVPTLYEMAADRSWDCRTRCLLGWDWPSPGVIRTLPPIVSDPGATVGLEMTAVAWAAIGLLAASLVSSLYYLGSRIDGLGSRIDTQGANLSD